MWKRTLLNCTPFLRKGIRQSPFVYVPVLHSKSSHYEKSYSVLPSLLFAAGIGCTTAAMCEQINTEQEEMKIPVGEPVKSLPVFKMADVSKHADLKNGIWVVYKHGVYDISRFISKHPGGKKILLGAGQSIEPFWDLYAAHNHKEVHQILEEYRIGNLDQKEVEEYAKQRQNINKGGLYANDPMRHPSLKVNSSKPFNAEPPAELLLANFITPNDLFFVRNHLPVPKVDLNTFQLEIKGLGVGEGVKSSFSLEELKKNFPHHKVVTTIQCAGNRRAEMSGVKKVNGLSWDKTAISTAEWTGVLLSDVLSSLDIDEDTPGARHIQFEGMDMDVNTKSCYGASIPVATATDKRKEVLLAFEMNGTPIPLDHGFPLRAIVPGTVGARNVKFLSTIVVSAEESPCFWQQKDYKGFPPNVDYNSAQYWNQAGPSIQELPVQSAIIEPKTGDVLRIKPKTRTNEQESDEEEELDDCINIKGYAWSGGGRGIIRVDVSVDGGENWFSADLSEEGTSQAYNRAWAWTPWELEIDVSDLPESVVAKGQLELRCKAVDSSYNVQPDSIAPIWNMRGVLNNAWHAVQINIG